MWKCARIKERFNDDDYHRAQSDRVRPVSTRIPPSMIEITNNITNPANEKNIPRPITLAARMFYSWTLTPRVNAKTAHGVKIKGDDLLDHPL